MEPTESRKTVTQDNALVSASYSLTLNEKRLLVACIAQLNPESKAWLAGRAEVTLTAGEWGELYGIAQKRAYGELRSAADALYNRSVRIYGDRKKGKEIRWLSAQEYNENEGRVTVTFSGPVLFYLTGMMEQFTTYDLLGVAGLKSVYSIRIYELACQFKSTGWRVVKVADLRQMCGIGDAYPLFSDFRKRVIDRACKEISEKSDMILSWSPVKKGRTIESIRFKIEPKIQGELFEEQRFGHTIKDGVVRFNKPRKSFAQMLEDTEQF